MKNKIFFWKKNPKMNLVRSTCFNCACNCWLCQSGNAANTVIALKIHDDDTGVYHSHTTQSDAIFFSQMFDVCEFTGSYNKINEFQWIFSTSFNMRVKMTLFCIFYYRYLIEIRQNPIWKTLWKLLKVFLHFSKYSSHHRAKYGIDD